jgi:enterochelin esterase family protein
MPLSALIAATLLVQSDLYIRTPADLERVMTKLPDPAAVASIHGYMDLKSLDKGVWPRVLDRKVALGVQAKGAKQVELRLIPNGPKKWLTNVGQDAFIGTLDLNYGDCYKIEYYADGKKVGDPRTLEIYPTHPDMVEKPGVPKGELRAMAKMSSKIYPDTTSEWWAYKPAKPEPEDGYGLIVFQDGQWARGYAKPALDNLIAKGEIPPCVALFIKPADHKDGYSIRWKQYDKLSDEYVRFVTEEYEPVAAKELGVKITTNPAKRMITGLSSGGICSWTAAWERPDKFGLVFSAIGSFVNIYSGETKREGGHNYAAMIRKFDKKPIRVFLQDGEQDLDNEHGNWWLANLEMVASLKWKGYDYQWVPGKGFHSDAHLKAILPDALKWLFAPAMKP